MNRIVFGIGSNLGDRELFIKNAITKLTQKLQLKNPKSSQILQNKALLLANSPKEWDIDFFNIAFSGNINLELFSPLKILKIIKEIEEEIGRIDRGKWSPREIDIDILAIDNLKIDESNILQIPHLELFNRDFFMVPFLEIEPEILQKIKSNYQN